MDSFSNKPLRIAVIGAGVRGTGLARQLASSHFPTKIVAVAEPDDGKRSNFAREFRLPENTAFKGWEDLTRDLVDCDAAIVATLDNQHTGPAIACLERNWHLLIEKPLSDSYEDCLRINKCQQIKNKVVAVCHTLRFMKGYLDVKQLLVSGIIGKLIHIEHMEAIGNKRFAHNYVRGRWSKESNNTFLLLHKCCHDIDYLNWLLTEPCRNVSSFGSLQYFNTSNAPKESTYRCIDCPLRNSCLYSAIKIYTECSPEEWPARDISKVHTPEAKAEALRVGPYGVCVWQSDNDVVDHQAVMMEFEGGPTATCTLSGFSGTNGRRIRLQGTEGEMLFDEAAARISIKRFEEKDTQTINIPAAESYHPEDKDIVNNWLSAIFESSPVAVDTKEALRTLAVVFAAEASRKENRVVEMKEFPVL
jgi:predicted dehydrogenase